MCLCGESCILCIRIFFSIWRQPINPENDFHSIPTEILIEVQLQYVYISEGELLRRKRNWQRITVSILLGDHHHLKNTHSGLVRYYFCIRAKHRCLRAISTGQGRRSLSFSVFFFSTACIRSWEPECLSPSHVTGIRSRRSQYLPHGTLALSFYWFVDSSPQLRWMLWQTPYQSSLLITKHATRSKTVRMAMCATRTYPLSASADGFNVLPQRQHFAKSISQKC